MDTGERRSASDTPDELPEDYFKRGVAKLIREKRLQAGLTDFELNRRAFGGQAGNQLGHYQAAQAVPSLYRWARLAQHLKVTSEELAACLPPLPEDLAKTKVANFAQRLEILERSLAGEIYHDIARQLGIKFSDVNREIQSITHELLRPERLQGDSVPIGANRSAGARRECADFWKRQIAKARNAERGDQPCMR